MADTALTLRRTDPERASYAVIYNHPDYGKIAVGHISEREGNPVWTDAWAWSIGLFDLPGSRWRQGTAPTRKAAEVKWKHTWPAFRAGLTEPEWFDARAAQEASEKKIAIYDARS